jgi:SAM-dependent methyltransferase
MQAVALDPTTLAVRAMYEQFPYPAVADPDIRVGSQARLLLSYGQLRRNARRPLQCLDAGCGRANGTLGAAVTQPDVQFTAVDINRVALADAKAKAGQLGLENIRFQEVDLMTLDGLQVPEGGFDVIVSSGVLHHLASPDEGLRQLRRVLAPHGVLSLMVYGALGREPLYRMVRAVDVLVPRDRPMSERLAVARRLAQLTTSEALRVGPIELTETLLDNELVDRYLNVNETSYDVASLWNLLERHDLGFLRWVEPEDWAVPTRAPAGEEIASHLTELQRCQLVEQIRWRPRLSLVAGTSENSPRQLPARDEWPALSFALNPDVSLEVETRNLRGTQRVERISYRLRVRPPVQLTGLTASVLLMLRDQTAPFRGRDLIQTLRADRIDRDAALDALAELLRREIVFCPHPTES